MGWPKIMPHEMVPWAHSWKTPPIWTSFLPIQRVTFAAGIMEAQGCRGSISTLGPHQHYATANFLCQRTNLKLRSEYSSINHGTKYRPLCYIGRSGQNKNYRHYDSGRHTQAVFIWNNIFPISSAEEHLLKLYLTLYSSTSLRARLVVGEKTLDLRIPHCP